MKTLHRRLNSPFTTILNPNSAPVSPKGVFFLFFLNNLSFFKKNYLFIYFWLRWVFVAARGLSLVVASGGYSSLQCAGFSLWRLLLWSTGSRHGLQQLWLTSSRAQAQQLWRTGLAALRHVGSSRSRARICVSCIGRRILNHCATREAPRESFISFFFLLLCQRWVLISTEFHLILFNCVVVFCVVSV